jgi:hypothetical protein
MKKALLVCMVLLLGACTLVIPKVTQPIALEVEHKGKGFAWQIAQGGKALVVQVWIRRTELATDATSLSKYTFGVAPVEGYRVEFSKNPVSIGEMISVAVIPAGQFPKSIALEIRSDTGDVYYETLEVR